MGRVLQVDPELVTAGARRLTDVSRTLDALAGRLGVLAGCASAAAGGRQLSRAADDLGREAARALAQGAESVALLGTATGRAGQDYRSTEHAQAGVWAGREAR